MYFFSYFWSTWLACDAAGAAVEGSKNEPLGRAAVVAVNGTQGWKWAVKEGGSSSCLINKTDSAERSNKPTYSNAISIPRFFSFSGDLVPAHTKLMVVADKYIFVRTTWIHLVTSIQYCNLTRGKVYLLEIKYFVSLTKTVRSSFAAQSHNPLSLPRNVLVK